MNYRNGGTIFVSGDAFSEQGLRLNSSVAAEVHSYTTVTRSYRETTLLLFFVDRDFASEPEQKFKPLSACRHGDALRQPRRDAATGREENKK